MLQPWKSDSITSHGVPITHCEQAAILVLKLKVVQLRKFSFPPNIFSSFPLYCLNLEWICFLTRSFISPSVLCSTLSFLKNMHLEHNAFNWWNLSTWYALWGFQSHLPVLTTDMKTTYIIPQRCAGWCPWTIVLPCWGESVVHRLMLRCFKTFDVEVSQNESRKLY